MTKKSEFTGRPAYSVAMSQEDGCIVMVKTNGKQVTIMGSLTRDMSLKFADSIQQWMPEALKRGSERPINVPVCATPECKNFVESSEEYCTDCLDLLPQPVDAIN